MVQEPPHSHSIVVESAPSAVVEVCKQILSKLQDNDFSKEDIFAVHLALEEAFLNALKHGNKMDPAKAVKISYSVDLEKIEISMSDEGNGFDPAAVPDPRAAENLYKTEGRGLLLMRSYMDEVRFNNNGNEVYMVRYKEKTAPKEVYN